MSCEAGFKREEAYSGGAAVGSRTPSPSSHHMDRIFGSASEVTISLDGNECVALLDTGSTVSTVSESFYRQALSAKSIQPLGELLHIEGAAGQSLPYAGYIELQVGTRHLDHTVDGLFLVVPDTRYGKQVPVILGTNVLNLIMAALQQAHGVRYAQTCGLESSWLVTFRCLNFQQRALQRDNGKLCVLKSVSNTKIVIPSNRCQMVS